MEKNNFKKSKGEKKKISITNVIFLALLLVILGIILAFLFMDHNVVGQCNDTNECGTYEVFYIQGQGFVCANDEIVTKGSFQTKMLMFKYASKKAINNEPSGCSCIENQCETN